MNSVKKINTTAQAIIDKDSNNTFAMAVSKHCPMDFDALVSKIDNGMHLRDAEGFAYSVSVVGLFIVHEDSFVDCIDELASSQNMSIDAYMVRLVKDDEAAVIRAMKAMRDRSLFDESTDHERVVFYNTIHAMVVHIVGRIIEQYSLKTSLIAHTEIEKEMLFLLGLQGDVTT